MITLQKFEVRDIPRLIQWTPDAKNLMLWAGPGYRFPLDHDQVMETFEKTRAEKPSHYMFKVVHEGTQEVIGHLEIMALDYQKGTAVLGRVLIGDQSNRGKGYGEEMIRTALKIGFEDLNLKELTLGVFDFNQAAIKCYHKLGFQAYETLENFRQVEGESWTLIRMKLVKGI